MVVGVNRMVNVLSGVPQGRVFGPVIVLPVDLGAFLDSEE